MAFYTQDSFPVGSSFVFYERLKESGQNPFWNSLYVSARNYFQKVDISGPSPSSTGGMLMSMGYRELEKEKRLLSNVFGVNSYTWDENDYEVLIPLMNEFLSLKTVYYQTLQRVKRTVYVSHQDVDDVFESYTKHLYPRLTRGIAAFVSNQSNLNLLIQSSTISTGIEEWQRRFKLMVERAMNDAFNRMVFDSENYYKSEWSDVLSLLNKFDGLRQEFKIAFFQQYNLEGLTQAVTNIVMNQGKSQLTKQNRSSTLSKIREVKKSYINNNVGNKDITSYVRDYTMSLLDGMSFGYRNKSAASTRENLPSGFSASNIRLFNMNYEVDLNDALNDLQSSTVKDKQNAVNLMERFYHQALSDLTADFIVYENVKMSTSTNEIYQGTLPISNLEPILNQLNIKNASAFINLLYQTIPGAIMSGESGRIREEASKILAEAIAYFLFDDFQALGEGTRGDRHSIHLLRLNGTIIPLSFFLIKAGRALQNAEEDFSKYVNFSIQTPGLIKYPNPIQTPKGQNIKDNVNRAWQEQRSDAMNQSRVTIRFLSNFKKLLSDIGVE